MPQYSVGFQNLTDRTWTMGVYQTIPNQHGMDSVSWQQTTASKGGFSGVQFDVRYNVALATYSQSGGRAFYSTSQLLGADLGTAWEIVVRDNVAQLIPAGAAGSAEILVRNNSNNAASPGIGMSGSPSVFVRSLAIGETASFQVTPTYYVGLFTELKKGEVISTNVSFGPLRLQYPTGETNATLTATMDGNAVVLRLTYGMTIGLNRS